MDKDALRHEIRGRLAAMSAESQLCKSKRICRSIVESQTFADAQVVMVFLSLLNEVDTTPLILHAWQQGKTVAAPKISWEQRHMIPVEITSLETGIKTDSKGLRNPISGNPVPFEDIDLVITPGLGFDKDGNRLGRGGGYYDRFFTSDQLRADRWGVAFSEQMCDVVPHDETDIQVHGIVTENGIVQTVQGTV
ncbi:MAG: 5-formyltetrahydrofolate cyclo-ligase [Planctomycetota bacterium]|jgi:5-formyltetrahydrofolate cyclo-ligase